MSFPYKLAPLAICVVIAACSQETKTGSAPQEQPTASQPDASSAKSSRPEKPADAQAAAPEATPVDPLAGAQAARKAAGDAYVAARDAFKALTEQVKQKSDAIAKAKEGGDEEAAKRLTEEFRQIQAERQETQAKLEAARNAVQEADAKVKALQPEGQKSVN